jgi:hypothetical protein
MAVFSVTSMNSTRSSVELPLFDKQLECSLFPAQRHRFLVVPEWFQ